jgi:hypothetical protein
MYDEKIISCGYSILSPSTTSADIFAFFFFFLKYGLANALINLLLYPVK